MRRDYRPLILARMGTLAACAKEMNISRQWLWTALLKRPTDEFKKRLAEALGYDSVDGMNVAVDQLSDIMGRRP